MLISPSQLHSTRSNSSWKYDSCKRQYLKRVSGWYIHPKKVEDIGKCGERHIVLYICILGKTYLFFMEIAYYETIFMLRFTSPFHSMWSYAFCKYESAKRLSWNTFVRWQRQSNEKLGCLAIVARDPAYWLKWPACIIIFRKGFSPVFTPRGVVSLASKRVPSGTALHPLQDDISKPINSWFPWPERWEMACFLIVKWVKLSTYCWWGPIITSALGEAPPLNLTTRGVMPLEVTRTPNGTARKSL
jgi:hypothetical protein